MTEHSQAPTWQPERIRLRPVRLLVSWLITAASLTVAAGILPGVDIAAFGGALLVALVIGALNAVLPPVLAALRLPLTLVLGFLVALVASALLLQIANDVVKSFTVDNFWWALLAALVMSGVEVILEVIFSANDDDSYTLKVVRRAPTRRESSSSRSMGWRSRSCAARCATGARRTWPTGSRTTRTASSSGSQTSPPRPERARRGSCLGRTTTSPRSAGSRRKRGR
jgi:putative membrane protein